MHYASRTISRYNRNPATQSARRVIENTKRNWYFMGYRFFLSLENNWLVFYHPFFNTFRVLSKKTVPLAPHVLNNTNRLKIQTVFTALSYYQSPSLNRCLQHCTKRILLCIYFYMGDETTVKSPKSNRH